MQPDSDHPVHSYGDNVFSLKTMRNYLSEEAYTSLAATICEGKTLDPRIGDEVADAMKTWAVEHGATHYCHWFQPLTGATAEKHDSFMEPDRQGGALVRFSGKELTQGEPDASSFPSGGIRATFEARGYTAWDPTSPAFLRVAGERPVLCIPTFFCGYHGEALDKKVPLLRSMEVLSGRMARLGRLFGIEAEGKRSYGTLGVEQEYFLVDRSFYERRLDLLQTGRTLFGRCPAKHQQMEDHYFGAVKPRVMEFMQDLDEELWRLGIPAKTRHNEVSPAQFEVACVYEELNLAVDHNMMVMQVLREVADRHGFACLLHEKPFAGVNGSGKHNNWSPTGPDGKNWLRPGNDPHQNALFLTMICTLLKAVDEHADMLRVAVASAGNDHRLGANEAPPAIISIFLGEQLFDVIEQIEQGGATRSKAGGTLEVGISSLPPLPRDATDRNRTSPFAFTGNKFEFRAVGSSMNCAGANVVLNTIVAAAIDDVCDEIEANVATGLEFNEALQKTLQSVVCKHKRILFNGDNYTAEWREEAARRGLPNLLTTPQSLEGALSSENIALFEKYGVLSRREFEARFEVYGDAYEETVAIEARCAAYMARTMILPAAVAYQRELAETLAAVAGAGLAGTGTRKTLETLAGQVDLFVERLDRLDVLAAGHDPAAKLAGMSALREVADAMEGVLPADLWPLPTYADMMFQV